MKKLTMSFKLFIKQILVMHSLFSALFANAQVLTKPEIISNSIESELRFKPSFSSICLNNIEAKGKSDWFAKKYKFRTNGSTGLENNITTLSFNMSEGPQFIKASFKLDN